MKTLFVMMLFFGGRTNVGSTVPGFFSLDACNRAIPAVIDTFAENGLRVSYGVMMTRVARKEELLKYVSASCMALDTE